MESKLALALLITEYVAPNTPSFLSVQIPIRNNLPRTLSDLLKENARMMQALLYRQGCEKIRFLILVQHDWTVRPRRADPRARVARGGPRHVLENAVRRFDREHARCGDGR